MLTERERVELERLDERMRERYRHLMAKEARRREELVDRYGADEIHGDDEEGGDE